MFGVVSSSDHNFDAMSAVEAASVAYSRNEVSSKPSWFGQMSVSRKLNLAVFGNTIVLALVALMMLGGTYYLGQGGQKQAIIASIEVRSNNAAIALVNVADALQRAEGTNSPGERSSAMSEVRSGLDLAHETLTDPIEFAGDRMPEDVGSLLEGYRSEIETLRSRAASLGSDSSEIAELRGDVRSLYGEVSTFAVDYHDTAASSADTLFASITTFLIAFLAITAAGVLISLIGARSIIADVSGMIRNLTQSMELVADGHTNTAIPGSERKDEIGAMARALAVFRGSSLELRDLTETRAQEAEEQLAQQQLLAEQWRTLRTEKRDLLEGLADGFEVSVGEVITAVSAASEQLKSTSGQMMSLADGSKEQAHDARSAMQQATANVTAAAAATDEFALSITEISRQASSSAALARDASDLVSSANARMGELSQAAVEIGEIAELIQSIAQRTNLLALNASIEAARGGEAGRGFAVVASEVKELANQTSAATSNVAEKITAMQDSTQSSAQDLSAIVTRIGELEQTAVVIASAVDQQSISGEDLARNIDTVATGAAQVGDRLEALLEASEATGGAADDVVGSATALAEHADELRSKAGRFIADVRRSVRDLDSEDNDLAARLPGNRTAS